MNRVIAVACAASLLLFSYGCSTTRYGSGPVGSLMRNPAHGAVVHQHVAPGSDKHQDRIFTDYCMNAGCAGCARFSVSLPKTVPAGGLPIVIVLSGLDAGQHSLDLVPDHSGYAVIAYEYPEALHEAEGVGTVFQAGNIKDAVDSIPGQVLVISDWARTQPWSDGKPASLIGVSLGGMLLPATFHLAQMQCHELGPSVIGYSGAGLYPIIYRHLETPAVVRGVAALFATSVLNNIEPSMHLPCIEGDFLIVESNCDEQ
ncbi:MAG: hypothetical protein KDK78_08075, partial [Chlamydiia bacterium]|nr:hypothetical protein [Chlamydiia bacterium]